ncbi:MAG: DUF3368 domain-containing protein [Nitrospinae bacterium]|nr:DUF3368 domain-containing protein [Nitrospinota bacterium]
MIGKLGILKELFHQISMPNAVWREIVLEGKEYPVSSLIKKAEWIKKYSISNLELYRNLSREIDEGEAEVIVLAIEKKAELVLLDEVEARDIAEYHGLNFSGTIGCLIEAKRIGIVSAIKPMLDKMINDAHYWIHDDLYKNILIDNNEL